MELFAGEVVGDQILVTTNILARARLLLNLGLKQQGEKLQVRAEAAKYVLTEEERKGNYEKIKALKDDKDNLVDILIHFLPERAMEPLVIEQIKIHESWLAYAEELIKWGEFVRAKELAKECNLHARILKDQDSYSSSLILLSSLAYLEGDSAGALRIAMISHRYSKDIEVIERAIV